MYTSPDGKGESLIAAGRIVVGLNHKGSSKWYTYITEPVFILSVFLKQCHKLIRRELSFKT